MLDRYSPVWIRDYVRGSFPSGSSAGTDTMCGGVVHQPQEATAVPPTPARGQVNVTICLLTKGFCNTVDARFYNPSGHAGVGHGVSR